MCHRKLCVCRSILSCCSSLYKPPAFGSLAAVYFQVVSDISSSSCFHRRAVNVVLRCQPDPRCLMMKTWAGASPVHPPPGTAFSKVDTRTFAANSHKVIKKNFRWEDINVNSRLSFISQSSYSLSSGTHLRFQSSLNAKWQDVKDLDEERSRSLKVHYARRLWLYLKEFTVYFLIWFPS